MAEKYVRFKTANSDECKYGRMIGDNIQPLSSAPWDRGEPVGELLPASSVIFCAPVAPSKIVCIGLNYHAHVKASYSADEAPKRPLIFLKPPSSIIGPGDEIKYPAVSERVDFEAELALVIGKKATNVSEEDADEYIFGCTCANDVTARDLQKPDGQWSRAKGFDTFCPVGPEIITGVDYRDLLVEGILNGEVKQSGRTAQMIFDIPCLIATVSAVMTLEPGDLLLTGTPAGILPMKPGDSIEVRIENIGNLSNTVISAEK